MSSPRSKFGVLLLDERQDGSLRCLDIVTMHILESELWGIHGDLLIDGVDECRELQQPLLPLDLRSLCYHHGQDPHYLVVR